MDNTKEITGIILCGGKSKRMGTDKGLILINQIPLISYAINLIEPFVDMLLISSNSEAYQQFGFPVIPDLFKNCGPAAGIFSCLKFSETDLNLVISCDMPSVDRRIFSLLIENYSEEFNAVIPVHNSYIEPLCGLYSKKIIPDLQQSIENGNLKLIEILASTNTKYLKLDELEIGYPSSSFMNINSPEEIKKFRNTLI